MGNIETIESLKDKRKTKGMKVLSNEIQKVIETTRVNGIAFGEAIKEYADWVLSIGEDGALVEVTKEKDKDKKVKDIFIERVKRR